MTCEELLILRENYKFKVKLADTSKILRKLVDKQLLISDGIGRGMKYYINKNFDTTVGKPLETVGKPLEQEIVILDLYIECIILDLVILNCIIAINNLQNVINKWYNADRHCKYFNCNLA